MSFRAAVLLLGLVLACAPATGGTPQVIPLTFPSGRVMQSEVMVSDEDRAMGLMFREKLNKDRALLFVFEQVGFHGIWMKNCRFPIDILWLDDQREVVYVTRAAPPCKKEPCPVYQPMRKAAYVIEMNAGEAEKSGVRIGAKVAFTLPN